MVCIYKHLHNFSSSYISSFTHRLHITYTKFKYHHLYANVHYANHLYAWKYQFLIVILLYVRVVLLNIQSSFIFRHFPKYDMMQEGRLTKYHILAHHQ